ncbi:putative glycosyltransferase [Erwinia sp. Ejp617]|nr:glycosyltransferase [Erwinia sp. Ejp617]ADP12975.1 putative glycosyltransferase [Erwinia sp. Ejp617]
MRITALIVTYNRVRKLVKTVEATLALPFCHVVIVDNASTDSTAEWLKTLNDQRVTVLTSETNSGGAGGFKYGAEYIADSLSTDWVAFYDDDAYPADDFFKALALIDLTGWACLSAKVIDLKGDICKMNIPWKKIPQSLGENLRYRRCPEEFIPLRNQPEEVVTLSFVGALIRSDVLKESHQFIRDDLFIYFDDVYYSRELKLRNRRIRYSPELTFYHDVNVVDNFNNVEWKAYYLTRNLILSAYIFRGRGCFSLISMILRIIAYLAAFYKHKNKQLYLHSVLRGICDGILNHRGRWH